MKSLTDEVIAEPIEIDPSTIKATDEVIAEPIEVDPSTKSLDEEIIIEAKVVEDVATISRGINRANSSADIDALQEQINNLPDGKQKTQLQKQLDKKKQELNDNVVITEAYEQPSKTRRNNNEDQYIIDAANQAELDAMYWQELHSQEIGGVDPFDADPFPGFDV